ncbi:hypothetical protein HID58_093800 [Brassica napus]|uniref:Uncharacterized protein n=1 Tax=Brassica napus TaxID=3708 RepID=A0ABQ7X9J9_BRANA|nr:hypothetical protein HID58_093800 [Brassica napus]
MRHFVEHLDDDDDDDVDFYKPLSYFVWRIFREMDKLLENHEFATHAVAASASVSLGTGLAYPLDTIKTIIQVGCKKLTPCQVVNRVFRVSGYSGLYSGLGWLTLGRISGVGASWLLLFQMVDMRSSSGGDGGRCGRNIDDFSVRADQSSTTMVSPMITKLLRRYNNLDMKSLTQTVSMLSVLNHKHRSRIARVPWMMTGTGNPPAAMDFKRPLDVASLEGVRASEEEVGPLSPVAISIAAGFSGAIAAAASHSFDTARTRAQCVILPKKYENSFSLVSVDFTRKFLKWNKPGKRLERWTGILPTDRTLLFRGIGTRMARSSVASTVIVGMILLSCRFIGSK